MVLAGTLNHTRCKYQQFLGSCLNTSVPATPGDAHGGPGVSSFYHIRFIFLLSSKEQRVLKQHCDSSGRQLNQKEAQAR